MRNREKENKRARELYHANGGKEKARAKRLKNPTAHLRALARYRQTAKHAAARARYFLKKNVQGQFHCSICGEWKDPSEFPLNGSYKGKILRSHQCKTCRAKRARELLYPAARARRLGTTPEALELLRQAQGGLCAICRVEPGNHLDHSEETGKSRAWLCGNCNRGLGMYHENPVTLRQAAQYLESYQNAQS